MLSEDLEFEMNLRYVLTLFHKGKYGVKMVVGHYDGSGGDDSFAAEY